MHIPVVFLKALWGFDVQFGELLASNCAPFLPKILYELVDF
jgi:hypothetical protein